MNKLAKIINTLDKDDLIKIRRDLIAGNIDKVISKRLDEFSGLNFSNKQCPVCGGSIHNNSFVLEFGSDYLRKRAFFDGVDCLEYFVVSKLKKNNDDLEHL